MAPGVGGEVGVGVAGVGVGLGVVVVVEVSCSYLWGMWLCGVWHFSPAL